MKESLKILSEGYNPFTGQEINGEWNEFGDYDRRYKKLQAISRNPQQATQHRKDLMQRAETIGSNIRNSDDVMNFNNAVKDANQADCREMSVKNYNTNVQRFESAKQTYSPLRLSSRGYNMPQDYVVAYNNWVNLNTQYLKAGCIYYNEYVRITGRMQKLKKRGELVKNIKNYKIIGTRS